MMNDLTQWQVTYEVEIPREITDEEFEAFVSEWQTDDHAGAASIAPRNLSVTFTRSAHPNLLPEFVAADAARHFRRLLWRAANIEPSGHVSLEVVREDEADRRLGEATT
jgi:hypothetical protein